MFETIFCFAAAALVLYKTLGVIAQISPDKFDGHPWQYIGFTLHHALLGAGSVATALDLPAGGLLLLAALAIMALADRRGHK